ncbi:hypothetical protein HELRODRAFT_84234 [Helobdella robusta]|uniref:CID domain-containing protein n=1 Tax=Helobdella robusta TaxID=6412 RepID=T1G5G1_HELRO|nr:hypothetical protein HELRODRAFT_84234 [Helobdella robusta]ESN99499.1 hypothetical protein HELRODRAFT_84234 [Helobdella robusta]
MASFSESGLVKKLDELNNSQQSIQTLSLWLIHHRKHSKSVVDIWVKELKKAKGSKKLTLIYLANDVIQNSKRKGPEYIRDFKVVLPDSCKEAVKSLDDKSKSSLERVLNIWMERNIYEKDFVDHIKKYMHGSKDEIKTVDKKPKATEQNSAKNVEPTAKQLNKSSSDPALEMQDGPKEPPTSDELIKALSSLENCASNDAAVRERIAAFPPEVSDANLLEKLSDTSEADALMKTVDEACAILTEYNSRLADEMSERKRIAKMLHNFIIYQKEALNDSEAKLTEYKRRLEKVDTMHKELKSHVQSLPDLTLLPKITGGLAPLPSAGDLFSSDK